MARWMLDFTSKMLISVTAMSGINLEYWRNFSSTKPMWKRLVSMQNL